MHSFRLAGLVVLVLGALAARTPGAEPRLPVRPSLADLDAQIEAYRQENERLARELEGLSNGPTLLSPVLEKDVEPVTPPGRQPAAAPPVWPARVAQVEDAQPEQPPQGPVAADDRIDAHDAEIESLRQELATLREQLSEKADAGDEDGQESEYGGPGADSEEEPEDGEEGEAEGKPKLPECVDTSEEEFSVRVGARIHLDSTWGTDDGLEETFIGEGFQNGYEFRRLRIYIDGKGFGIFNYRIEPEFSNPSNFILRDVYMGVEDLPIGNFRIGHFREPVGLEELSSSNDIEFTERNVAAQQDPVRSLGFMFFDTYDEEMGAWQLGSFLDDFQDDFLTESTGDYGNVDSEARTIVGRLTRLVYWDEVSDGRSFMHVGGAVRYADDQDDEGLVLRFRPEIRDTFRQLGVESGDFDYYMDYGLEWLWQLGSLKFQSEYIATSIASDERPYLHGAYFLVGYFLTGESRDYDRATGIYKGITPYENFWWVETGDGRSSCGMGAWEIAARVSYMDADDDGLTALGGTNGTRGELHNFTFAVNWYWNPAMRVMTDFVVANLDDAVTGREAQTQAVVSRFQLAW